MTPRIPVFALAVLVYCSPFALAPAFSQSADCGVAEGEFAEPYRIGVGDKLKVDVWKNTDLSIDVPVRPDGMISVPLVGDVMAGGKTPMAVAGEIKKALEQYIRNPHVTVIVTDLISDEFLRRIRVTGAVGTPSSMTHRQGMTVLDAVLETGGLTEFASADKTKVYRECGGAEKDVIPVQLGKIIKKGDLETNITLRPGDIVTVPERFF